MSLKPSHSNEAPNLLVIREAIDILESKFKKEKILASSSTVKDYLRLHIADRKDEHFGCLFLDTRHRLLRFEELFRGTIDGATIHPRVVARTALELNASAVIFTHNHPSGNTSPSEADIQITKKLKEALQLFDIRTLDHIIVSVNGATSLAELGLT